MRLRFGFARASAEVGFAGGEFGLLGLAVGRE